MPKKYGYARVSSKEQNADRQIAALLEHGLTLSGIFVDKQSGKDFNRPKYKRLLKKLRQGDTMFIKSIDRLGRNYEEIIEQWRVITKEIRADIVVLDMPLLDTRQKEKDLTGTFIADLQQRQAEGITAAKARGVKFGRPPSDRPPDFPRLQEAWLRQEISARAAAKELGIHHRTFQIWATENISSADLNG